MGEGVGMAEPKFCTYCGNRLIVKVRFDGFDKVTGERDIEEHLVCPNRLKWTNWLWKEFHDKYWILGDGYYARIDY